MKIALLDRVTGETIVHDKLRGHWGGWGCACPTPTDAPATRLTADQLVRFEALGDLLAVGPISPADTAELRTLFNIAFPDFDWRL